MMVQFHQGGFLIYSQSKGALALQTLEFGGYRLRVTMGSLGIEPLLKDHESF